MEGDWPMKLHAEKEASILEEFKNWPCLHHLRFELDSLSPGCAVMGLSVTEEETNRMGTLHGGLLASLADTASDLALMTVTEVGREVRLLADLHVRYFHPVELGERVRARARVQEVPGQASGRGPASGRRPTSRKFASEVDLLNEKGLLVAKADGMYLVRSAEDERSGP